MKLTFSHNGLMCYWVFLKKHDQPNLVKTNSVGKKSFTSHSVFQYKIKLKSLKVLGLIILQFYLNFLKKLKRRANFYYVYFPLIFSLWSRLLILLHVNQPVGTKSCSKSVRFSHLEFNSNINDY